MLATSNPIGYNDTLSPAAQPAHELTLEDWHRYDDLLELCCCQPDEEYDANIYGHPGVTVDGQFIDFCVSKVVLLTKEHGIPVSVTESAQMTRRERINWEADAEMLIDSDNSLRQAIEEAFKS